MSDITFRSCKNRTDELVRINQTKADGCYGIVVGHEGCIYTAADLRRSLDIHAHCVQITVPTYGSLYKSYVDVNDCDLETVDVNELIAAEIMQS
jgi:hypothetical protein